MSRILVVDDEPGTQTLVVEYLGLSGHQAVPCPDGESALGLLNRDPAFDLVVLDKRLPGLSGDDVLKAIRSDPRLKALPVIMLSASVQAGDLKDGPQAADLYMAKPLHPRELASAVDRLLQAQRG
ncbi:MAG: response regulator [Elusimicrobiota bacterium]|jgi:CheY-like chemotaxis protein